MSSSSLTSGKLNSLLVAPIEVSRLTFGVSATGMFAPTRPETDFSKMVMGMRTDLVLRLGILVGKLLSEFGGEVINLCFGADFGDGN